VHDEVDPRRGRLADAHVELHRLRTEPLLEDLRELLPDAGVVAVAREVDEHRDVAAVGVLADEHPHRPALAGVHRGLRHRHQLVDRRVQQLVAGIGLQGVHQRLAGVTARVEPAALEDRLRLLLHQRDPQQRLRVRRARQQPQEPALAVHLAGLVEGLHADVVEVRRAVHRGAGVGLGEDQQGLLAGLGLDRLGQSAERLRHLLVGPEDAEAGARDRPQQLVLALPLELVLPVAEEREVLVGQPLQELPGLSELLGVQRRRVALEPGDDVVDLGMHLLPVLDRLAHVAEHPLHVRDDLRRVVALTEPVDLHVHPRLADRVSDGRTRPVLDRHHALHPAGEVTDHVEVRVDDRVHAALLAGQLHGEGVDEERHVVDDDLDHGVPVGRPAVLAQGGRERPHLGCPLRPLGGQLVVRGECAVHVDVGAVDDVLGSYVPVVGMQQRVDLVVRRPAGASSVPGQGGGLVDQLGLVHVMRRH
jgi:hypothetical protein